MPHRAIALAVLLGACSDPATSALRGDAGTDTAPPRDSAPTPDAPDGSVTPDVPDGSVIPDVPDVSVMSDVPDVSVMSDVPDGSVMSDAPDGSVTLDAPDGSVAPRVVQLGGLYVGSATQVRLDALYRVLGVTAQRIEPGAATAENLRDAVIVSTFAARPTDWTAARYRPVLDAVRAGAWMLADAFGPWPLHEAGELAVDELMWSRTAPCVGTSFWLDPAPTESAWFGFAGITSWVPTSEIVPQEGPVTMRYGADSAPMTIPVFNALLPATRVRHAYVEYVQSYCEPDVNRHPWCVDNARFCNGERGARTSWVDEFVVGSGRVFTVSTASHNPMSLQWGDVVVRMQANVLREALRRLAR